MTNDPGYDPEGVARYFDELAHGEWDRLDATLTGRISFRIHLKQLLGVVSPGTRVLDAGCGPGRFAIAMLRAGAHVTLADISSTQLDITREKISEARLLDRVEGFHRINITNLTGFGEEFDIVVCYGGALSYVRDRHRAAITELVRVTKPGGSVIASVMSLYGMLKLIGILDVASFLVDMESHWELENILNGTGYALTRSGSDEFHVPFALFSAKHLADTFEEAGCSVVTLAAANPLSAGGMEMQRISANAGVTSRLLDLELALCDRPEYVDSGEHLIIVAQKR